MKTIKVIIAEDEPIVARYIKGIIEAIPEFSITAICDNGDEVMAAYKKDAAQVLITDIKMPGMDGLELIGKLKMARYNPQIIIISGFKDFEYAKQAIALGVECYITKPVDVEELKKSLEKIRMDCIKGMVLERKNRLEKSLYNMDDQYLREVFPFHSYSLLAVYMSEDLENTYTEVWKDNYIYFRYRNALFFLEGIDGENTIDSCRKQLQEIARRIIFSKSRKRTCTTLIIREVEDSEDYLRLFRRVNQILTDNVVLGKLVSKDYDSLKQIKSSKNHPDEELLKKIDIRISAKEWNKICKLLAQLFDVWKENGSSIHRMKSKLLSIIDKLQKNGILQENQAVVNEYVEDCVRYSDSFDEMKESVCGFFKKFLEMNGNTENNIKSSEQTYWEIRDFVLQNMEKNYSLNEISSIFGISQPYIRKLFHMYVDASYNEWILKTKIEHAKELMRTNPDLMIKEVAEKIGYEQLYFSTVFNKYEGISPSKFKGMKEWTI